MGRPPKSSTESLTKVVSESLSGKKFDIEAFKKSKHLSKNIKFKEQRWIPLSKAIQDALSIPGIAMGHINLVRGHSDTGKTTILLEAAVNGQKMGLMPVFIVTEMKWNWEHVRQMGFDIEEVVDETTGEVIDYKGNFIYVDRSSLSSVEDVAGFIMDLLNEQQQGKLPYDLLFLWDSSGSIPCNMSIEQGKNNSMWNAGAMNTQFGNFVNQKFPMSRKETSPYTNTFVVINKVGVQPAETVMSKPRMTNKGGNTLYWDASIVLTFGNVTNSGTSKINATKDGKQVEFAKRTKIACDKNHVNGITTKSTVIVTVHGFIADDDKAIKDYKKEHSKDWFEILGSGDFDVIEDDSEWDESNNKSILTVDEEIDQNGE